MACNEEILEFRLTDLRTFAHIRGGVFVQEAGGSPDSMTSLRQLTEKALFESRSNRLET